MERGNTMHEKMTGWLLLPLLGLLMGAGYMPRQQAAPDEAQVAVESTVWVDVLANDTHLGEGLELVRVNAGTLGSTSIQDGQVRYVAGAQPGVDRFGYMVRMANGRTAIGVVDVEVTPPPRRLFIHSEWAYPESWGGWVPVSTTVWLGGQAFEAEFQTPTDFIAEVFVPESAMHEVVVLEVLGEGPQGQRTRFRAVQRSAAVLFEEASQGEYLEVEYYPALRVTPYTTAVAAMLQDLNGGDLLMDDAHLRALSPLVDTELMVDHAALFHAVNYQWLPMDGQGGDSYDLIASRTRVQDHLATLAPDALVNPRFHLHGFTHQFLSVWTEDKDYLMVKPSAQGTVNHGRVTGMRLKPDEVWDGAAGDTLLDTGWTADPDVWLSSHDNALIMFTVERAYDAQRFSYACNGGVVEAVRLTERVPERLHRYAITPDFEHFEYVSYHGYSYVPVSGGVVPCQDTLSTGRWVWQRSHGYRPGGRIATPAPAALGRVATTLVNPAPIPDQFPSQFTAGVVDFATGSVDVPGYAAQGVVGVDEAGYITLAVDALPGTPRAGRFEYRFEPIREDGHGGQEWSMTARLQDSADNHFRMMATPLVRLQGGLVLGAGMLDGAWTSGFDVSEEGMALRRVGPFRLHFDAADWTGHSTFAGQPDAPFSWSVEGNVMRASTFVLATAPHELIANCPMGISDCREVRRRVWQPVRTATLADGRQRLYVVEEVWQESGTQLQRVSRRMNFYDAD